jgi:hypothetical protein
VKAADEFDAGRGAAEGDSGDMDCDDGSEGSRSPSCTKGKAGLVVQERSLAEHMKSVQATIWLVQYVLEVWAADLRPRLEVRHRLLESSSSSPRLEVRHLLERFPACPLPTYSSHISWCGAWTECRTIP